VRRELLGAAVLYALLAIAMTWPLAVRATQVVPIGADNLHLAWVLAWIAHAIPTDPLAIFDGNIFHPVQKSIALSDPNVSSAALVAPFWWIVGSPGLLVNALFLLSFVFCGLAAQALAREWGANVLGSIAAGILFAFAPMRFTHVDHVQLYAFWWTPLALLALDRFLRDGSGRALAAAGVCLVLQAYASLYLAVFAGAAVVVHFLVALASGRARLTGPMAAKIVVAAVAAVALCLPLGLAYAEVRITWGAARSLEQNVRYAASPLAYLSMPADSVLWGRALAPFADPVAPWEKYLFPGLVTVLLALVAVVREPRSWMLRVGLTLALVGFVCSLGPVLLWKGESTGITLPYLWAWEWLPPLRGLRGPARWGLLAGLGLALAAAVGATRLPRGLVSVLLALAVLEAWVFPLPTTAVPATGPSRLDEWLARSARGAVLELPVPRSASAQYARETERIYRSAFHRRRIANGYSGYTPPPYTELGEVVATELPERVLPVLAAWDVRTIVVHAGEMPAEALAAWRALASAGSLRSVFEGDGIVVYEHDVTAPPPGRLAARFARPPSFAAGEWGTFAIAVDAGDAPAAMPPAAQGWHRGRARWIAADGAIVETRAKTFCPPIVYRGHETRTAYVVAPPVPGPHRLEIDTPCFELRETADVGAAP
jgi:hypothetical protein